jgi:hypothetical protein
LIISSSTLIQVKRKQIAQERAAKAKAAQQAEKLEKVD